MGEIRIPLPVKLFIGMLSPEPPLFYECADLLASEYGPIDCESGVMTWDRTDYYRDEMGPGIKRVFIFFQDLADPGILASVKHFTNSVESRFLAKNSDRPRRRINLDPGYVTEAKVVLATTKDFSHRLYIGANMFAEVTLRYDSKKRSFAPFEHTYYDFRTDTYREMFNKARELLRKEMHRMEETGKDALRRGSGNRG